MPNLKPGERMQRCQSAYHDQIRLQKYYVVRTYFNDLEQKFCAGCCGVLKRNGLVEYTIGEGYIPTGGRTFEGLLAAYRAEKYRD